MLTICSLTTGGVTQWADSSMTGLYPSKLLSKNNLIYLVYVNTSSHQQISIYDSLGVIIFQDSLLNNVWSSYPTYFDLVNDTASIYFLTTTVSGCNGDDIFF